MRGAGEEEGRAGGRQWRRNQGGALWRFGSLAAHVSRHDGRHEQSVKAFGRRRVRVSVRVTVRVGVEP